MDNRTLLAIVLSIGILILFQYLYLQYLSPKPNQEALNMTQNQKVQGNLTPEGKPFTTSTLNNLNKGLPEKKITLRSPLYEAEITNYGVRLSSYKLLKYNRGIKEKEPVELVSAPREGLPLEIYTTQAPYLALVPFSVELPEKMVLSQGDKKDLVFRTKVSDLDIEKRLLFRGDSYYYDLEVRLQNSGNATFRDRLLVRGVFAPFSLGSGYVFKGPFYYTDQLNEVKLKDTLSEYTGPLKYLGYMDVYFLTALIPLENGTFKGTFRKLSEETNEFIFWGEEFTLNPGESKTFKFKVYMGPKKAEELKKEYPLLARSLYFGIFDFVAKPLLYLLKFLYQFTHNYGWAIIIITFLIRILFYPLNHISYKSMKKMQELQPVFQRLREKYKDDPQTLQKEMMNLYRTHKINPFSGCLPILIQIPVFIAFYKVLLMSIELRHAPFMLWINDLSSPERLYLGSLVIPWLGGIPVLTILMGVSMFFQQKLTPSSMDPTQEKIMLILPLFFTILFINFPSGLVLYWFVNNLLSIGQQLITFKVSKKTVRRGEL
jgi:YidC/Oxa1 family membrane protein insertase